MKELSLNILDIAQNSIKANASLLEILLEETNETLKIIITDNGCGMTPEILERVTDPFFTTRTTRKVGMGLPLFKMEAEQTGGNLEISSKSIADYPDSHGTKVSALFYKNHIDFTPLGDVISTVITIIQGSCGKTELVYRHTFPETGLDVKLDTRILKETLGNEVPLSEPEVLQWITEFLKENYNTNHESEENKK